MSKIPEGVETVSGEGKDLVTAIHHAAEILGTSPENVAYTLDMAHFRSQTGGMKPASTVKVIGWKAEGATDLGKIEYGSSKPASKPASRPAPTRTEDAPEAPAAEAAPEGTTEASEAAAAWFSGLLGHMDIEGSVTGTGEGDKVRLEIRADRAGRIIGKRGSTLRAIRHLLGLALAEHGELRIDIDVDDPEGARKKSAKGEERGRDRDRGDRDRGDRDRKSKDRPRKDRSPRDRKSSSLSEDKLRALARRAAERAAETGKTVTINLELNSYDRRIVHMEISEIDGVDSESEERDGKKFIQVIPA